MDKYLELICKPIELAKGLCYVSKVLELHCTWPGQVKSAVKEGVGRFIKNSKQRIIDYTKDTFLYELFIKTVRKGDFCVLFVIEIFCLFYLMKIFYFFEDTSNLRIILY